MDRARLFLKRGLLALGLLIIPALLFAQGGPYSAQIQQALQAFVQQVHTWTATQTFTNVVVNGTCTGCGAGSPPGGSDTQIQYNNAGAFGGAPLTWTAASTQFSIGGQYFAPLIDDGNSGTADTINWNSGNEHISTLTGNVTYTFSNPVSGGRYVLLLSTGAGSFSVTWPATVLWPGGATPTITTTASKVDVCTFIYVSSATKYYGACSQNY